MSAPNSPMQKRVGTRACQIELLSFKTAVRSTTGSDFAVLRNTEVDSPF